MRPILRSALLLALVIWCSVTTAAPSNPHEKSKDDASEVVSGTVQQLKTDVERDRYPDGRVETTYTARIKVEKVERTSSYKGGRGIEVGDVITVRWHYVEWSDRTGGHRYEAKENAVVCTWLFRACGGSPDFVVIDNPAALENVPTQKP
jgi:hypothetical protein